MSDLKFEELFGNRLLVTDSYKPSHFFQYPDDTTALRAYLEARRGARYPRTMVFGPQAIVKRYFDWSDCPLDKREVLAAEAFWKAHGEPFNTAGWMKVVDVHGGQLPITVRSIPEGSVVPVDMPLMTVDSLDPELWWLVTYMETALMRVWYPMTVATRSFHTKQVIRRWLEKTSDSPEQEINFKLHDFGGRGVSSDVSAELGGSAHLLNFLGTDTAEAIVAANAYYPDDDGEFKMHGFSIPAMEHSSIITWGQGGEIESFRNMLRQCKQRGFKLIACVSDTNDLMHAVKNIWCGELLQEVKDSGMCVVVRPDSGDPVEVNKEVLRTFASSLGSEMKVNKKGYVVLPDYFRIIQGDGNDDENSVDRVYAGICGVGFSATNLGSGMGGGLLQKLDRDTQRFAYKPSAVRRGVMWSPTRKVPKTDPSKSSKGGRVTTGINGLGQFVCYDQDLVRTDGLANGYWDPVTEQYLTNAMRQIFHDGVTYNEESFETIRNRAMGQR